MLRMKSMVLSILLLAFGGACMAAESDELREKAKAMLRESAELAENGHKEEAGDLKRKATAMLEEAERLAADRRHAQEREHPQRREVEELERVLAELRNEERHLADRGNHEALVDVRHEAERIERELHEITGGRHRRPGPPPREEIGRRLEHMHVAIEHLNHAGLHDVAKHVAERAEATERELHERPHHPPQHEREAIMHEVIKQMEELRHELAQLRNEVNELRENR